MHIPDEYYHIYNHGAHKAPIFQDKNDYERFVALLFTANDRSLRMRRVDLRRIKPDQLFTYERDTLVDIIAYCLMPNHLHIVIKEKSEDGISCFIHKLCTSYSMYFNFKYDHSGTILQGQYKSKHVDNDDYFRYLIQYVHLNPYGIEEPEMMKVAKQEYLDEAIEFSKKYEYSSYKDYLGENRAQRTILTPDACAG